MESKPVEIRRLIETDFLDIKDPCVVRLPDGKYLMYATVGFSETQEWGIGCFSADHPAGPWQERGAVHVHGVDGPEVCAPSVHVAEKNGVLSLTMYVQTSCFHADGIIAEAVSTDGLNFQGLAEPAMTKERIPSGSIGPLTGLYDVAVSDLSLDGVPHECMVFSGYRRTGCGDLYISLREKGESAWGTPRLALRQEDVPFHNQPDSKNFEWGLEGAKLVQLADDAFLLTGVCFLDKDPECAGTRQRVFFAAASSPAGRFLPMDMPVEPTQYDVGRGENGHPDVIDMGENIGLLYQERAGNHRTWHLRYMEMGKEDLTAQIRDRLRPPLGGPQFMSRRPGADISP